MTSVHGDPFHTFPSILFGLSLLLGPAACELSIIRPASGLNWVVKTNNQLYWQGGSPSTFDIRLVNSNSTILSSNLTLATNISAELGGIFVSPDVNPGDGYQIVLYNATNSSIVYSTSDRFVILPVNSSTTATATTGMENPTYTSATASDLVPGASTFTGYIPPNATKYLHPPPSSTQSASPESSPPANSENAAATTKPTDPYRNATVLLSTALSIVVILFSAGLVVSA
ncbi:hypothetical protein IE53DRAFT_392533 [Violaceomyces palustris]|uniref:Uncharacterized protein n=1 Tax=Violaceomyces palustris TaxID=1673888 RepID=A0ACD0NL62_9BASI|nr:hypothetical protein IE53DRAFT_392533 [Violaceomyces palustris]